MRSAGCTMRPEPDLALEQRLWNSGLTYVAGLDEAGRGALAGPVAVGAVVLPGASSGPAASRSRSAGRTVRAPLPRRRSGGEEVLNALHGVRDSKQMTARQREMAAPRIQHFAAAWSVGFASPEEIDSDGIVLAARLAALRALEKLGNFPEYLLTDFRLELPELDVSQTSIVRGDACCLSIAAASVLAKTARDALMRELELQIPGYGLATHKGYGTPGHRRALRRMGRSPVHRKTFSMGR